MNTQKSMETHGTQMGQRLGLRTGQCCREAHQTGRTL
jgi:hypothetical protein